MAKVSTGSIGRGVKVQISRPGVHAKTKTSNIKKSRNYKKRYRGQGK